MREYLITLDNNGKIFTRRMLISNSEIKLYYNTVGKPRQGRTILSIEEIN